MAEHTAIGWCDGTCNFWIGCTKVSVGEHGACEHCYAEDWAKRYYPSAQWGDFPRKRTAEATWKAPYAWDRKAAREGTRPFIFTNSLADMFDNQVDPQWRADAFNVMRETPRLVWLLLTKRPQNIARLAAEAGGMPDNAAIGCTVVTQKEAERDAPHLLSAPTRMFRFLSVEPMLGRIDLDCLSLGRGRSFNALTGEHTLENHGHISSGHPTDTIDWVICGGESGPHRREMSHDWARSLRDQCQRAGVPFFFKQWPGLRPKSNGCELDGREWKERPRVAPLPAREKQGAML